MEDSFRVRFDRAFGSLPSSSSCSSLSLSSSLWCLTDEELEKRSWNRESDSPADDDGEHPFPLDVDRLLLSAKGKLGAYVENRNHSPNPNAGDYHRELEDDLQELDDDAGEGTSVEVPSTSTRSCEAADDEEEELDVRSSIGVDCTLHFEEEGGEYHNVAVGKERTGDRLYMSDVTDYTPHLNSYDEIPSSFKEASKDPRANHLAAKLRLNSLHVFEQTAAVSDGQNNKYLEAARSSHSLHVSEQTMTISSDSQNNKDDVEAARRFNSLHVSEQTVAVVSDPQNNSSEDRKNLKSILKRKKDQMSKFKSEKRVRFEPSYKSHDERESEGDRNVASETSDGENTLPQQAPCQLQDSSSVPDYIRNPSRYTHYTFDSLSDMNEESNHLAYMDFINMIKKSKQSGSDEVPADLSKTMIFSPKKKVTSNEATQTKDITMEEPIVMKSLPISFASHNKAEDGACEMEVDDEQETVAMKVGNGKIAMKVGNGKRAARQYRLKQSAESNKSDS